MIIDQHHADAVAAATRALNNAIIAAYNDGLEIEVKVCNVTELGHAIRPIVSVDVKKLIVPQKGEG